MKREEGFYREGAEGAKLGGRDMKGYGGFGIGDLGLGICGEGGREPRMDGVDADGMWKTVD
jgi:hypothetical protein